ncbi:hypothetical protein CEP54_013319 [Fusarium duplospermum]|uniref:Heterokaryon incompatibility domain-containing protein n=1 Tax=Fusarium duplospermum TaxID=1325734 RepID=A0A428P3M7_9HYPO|nr:hypothetical protein CEP54_013319 [Fusarium duplospermum]
MDASTTTPRADKLGILVWLGTFLGPSVMKNSHRRYAYEPLDEDSIRLITIKPGPWDSIIECEVDTKRLGQGESRFRALSYVWGDSNVRRTIHLNGTEFEVTVNLFDGLRQIRKSMFEDGTLRQLPIWADAICINQEDKEEKAKQVPNMHQIYSTAKEVLLWLGAMPIPPDFLEAYTFGEFRQLLGFRDEDCPMSEELRERFLEAYVMGARSTEFFDILVDRRLPVRYKLMFTAMASALRRCSYFQRVWTVQEAVLAKDKPVILVNRHVLSWDEFAHRIDERTEKLSDVSNRPHSSFSGISSLRVQRARRGPRLVHHRLLDLVEDFSDLSCTEPVDKIYGLLAMVPLHRFPKSLRPDYNISCEEVYWKYAEYIFYTTGNLTLLDKCKGNLPGVPSWVPAIGTTEETISEVKSKTFRKSDAPPRAYPSFSDDSREMSITGYNYGVCMDRMT